MPKVQDIEVVEDLTDASTLARGFIKMRRVRMRNAYDGGGHSKEYPVDFVYRTPHDSVCVILYGYMNEMQQRTAPEDPYVVVRRGLRPTLRLRGLDNFFLEEVVAGVLEHGDAEESDGVGIRAIEEIKEETGLQDPLNVLHHGTSLFASPGYTSEQLNFMRAELPFGVINHIRMNGDDENLVETGDGSPMEDGGRLLCIPLSMAINFCRTGTFRDMKTEVALCRLRDLLMADVVQRSMGTMANQMRAVAEGL